MTQQQTKKITMYYDSSCPICRTEAYHMRDEHSDKIQIVTIDDALDELKSFGIERVDAMTYLCVADTDGRMIKGADAVRLLHQTAGTQFVGINVATILSLPIVKQMVNWIYPIFARNRYYMPSWLTRLLFGKVAEEETGDSACDSGVCKIPPAKR